MRATGRRVRFLQLICCSALLLVPVASAQTRGVNAGLNATARPKAKPAPVGIGPKATASATVAAPAPKPVPAKVDPANCVACHKDIGNAAETGSKHAAVDMGCDSCHTAHDVATPVSKEDPKHLKKAVPALCADCHDVQERAGKAKVQHAVTENCIGCHNPHSSPNPKLLAQPQVAMCEGCHAAQAEAHQSKKFLHKPVFEAGCSTCHDPHASDHVARLRAPVNELCQTCHAQNAKGDAGSDAKTLVLFGGAVKLPGDYLQDIRRISLRDGGSKGHPTAAHPVTGAKDAVSKKQMTCTSCHDPHASVGSQQLFITEKRSSSPLCIRCH